MATGARAGGVSNRVHPARHDLAHDFFEGRFDLVNASYFHTPLDIPRTKVLRRAAAAVTPGGLLIIVEHASIAPWSWQTGNDVHFPTPTRSPPHSNWTIPGRRALPRPQRTATGPAGQRATVTDNVLTLRRTSSRTVPGACSVIGLYGLRLPHEREWTNSLAKGAELPTYCSQGR